MKRIVTILLLLAPLTACFNLKEVRDYAGQSSQLTAYSDLTKHWAATSDREKLYLSGDDAKQSAANDAGRKAALKDLLSINDTVSTYFAVMAKLAGDDGFTVSGDVDKLAKSINESKLAGITADQVNAYSEIVKTITTFVLSGYQQAELHRYIEAGNAPIRSMLNGMDIALHAYAGTLDNEEENVAYLLGRVHTSVNNDILAAVANIELTRVSESNADTKQQIDTVREAILKISDGHQKLFDNRKRLTAADLVASLTQTNAQLSTIRKNLKTLKE